MRSKLLAVLIISMFTWTLSAMELKNADAAPMNRNIALGVYVGDGPGALQSIQQVESSLNFKFPIIHLYTGFNKDFSNFRSDKLEPLSREGSVPLVSWAPGVAKGVLYDEIASGHVDPYLKRWAQGAKAWNKPLLVRFAYEMNMTNMAWTGAAHNGGPEAFVKAWRHIHQIFREEGATNVSWVWCPHADQNSPYYTDVLSYYPGDDVVDWVGLDGYHWGSGGNPSEAFDHIFKASYDTVAKKGKPMMIAEMGTAANGKAPGSWIKAAFDKVRTDYPMIQAVVYFNADFSQRGEKDWRFTERPETRQAFKEVTQNSDFAGNVKTLLLGMQADAKNTGSLANNPR